MLSILINPFKRYRENQLLLFGISLTLIASFFAYFTKARFDGVLDMHLVENIKIWQPFSDNLINILTLTITLFIAAIAVNRKTRFIDILVVSIIARIPYYILLFFNIGGHLNKISLKLLKSIKSSQTVPKLDITVFEVGFLLLFALFSILFLVWYITLLFNGFKISCNAKGLKPILLFISCVILSEIISKFIVSIL